MKVLTAAVAVALVAAQTPCDAGAAGRLADAAVRVDALDLSGARDRLHVADRQACAEEAVARLYLGGLVDAREAFRQGAPPESLVSVRAAIVTLATMAGNRPGPAEVARLVLHAAAAAAQSERDEMALYLDSALRMDALLRDAGQPGVPLLAVAEAAGDLWLQVHQYEDARRAYYAAVAQVGLTLHVRAGLARVAARFDDQPAACAGYRALLETWGGRTAMPPQIVEARAYVDQAQCAAGGPGGP